MAPILQVLGDQMGTFEAVGAAGFAQPAVEAGLHFGQFRSPILVHVLLPRGAAQQLRKPADGVQLNPLGAGHAVAAAAAEIPLELGPVPLHHGGERRREGGRVVWI